MTNSKTDLRVQRKRDDMHGADGRKAKTWVPVQTAIRRGCWGILTFDVIFIDFAKQILAKAHQFASRQHMSANTC